VGVGSAFFVLMLISQPQRVMIIAAVNRAVSMRFRLLDFIALYTTFPSIDTIVPQVDRKNN